MLVFRHESKWIEMDVFIQHLYFFQIFVTHFTFYIFNIFTNCKCCKLSLQTDGSTNSNGGLITNRNNRHQQYCVIYSSTPILVTFIKTNGSAANANKAAGHWKQLLWKWSALSQPDILACIPITSSIFVTATNKRTHGIILLLLLNCIEQSAQLGSFTFSSVMISTRTMYTVNVSISAKGRWK